MSHDAPPPEVPVPLTPANEVVEPAYVPDEYDPLRASNLATSAPRRRARSMTRSRLRVWLWIGGLLWAIGLAGWLALFVRGCEPADSADPAVPKKK
jgi:hypothetical protein